MTIKETLEQLDAETTYTFGLEDSYSEDDEIMRVQEVDGGWQIYVVEGFYIMATPVPII